MWALLIYAFFMLLGAAISVGIGATVSNTWSDTISLPVFLGCYFVSLWLAWVVTVRIADSMNLQK